MFGDQGGMSREDKRNLVIAIAAIFVLLIAWQFLMPVLFPPDERPRRTVEQIEPATADGLGAAQVQAGADTGADARMRQAGTESPRVAIDSPRLYGSLSLLGGRIDSVTLRDYRETAEDDSPEIVLLSPRDAERPYFADFGWAGADEGLALPEPDTLWSASRGTVTTGSPATLTWDNGEGLVFTRHIAVDEGFVFTVTDSVRNETDRSLELVPYSRVARFSTGSDSGLPFKPLFIFEDGALGVFGDDYREADYEDMQEAYEAARPNRRRNDEYRYAAESGWLGLTDKFWLVALIPDQETPFQGSFEYVPVDEGETASFQAIYEAAPLSVGPGGTASHVIHLFAGAKEINLLDRYEDTLGADRFDLAVDFGPTWFLSKPMFYIIDFFNRATGNFGVAILLLTICVRVLLFPLANKAYASMSRMRKLQPEMIRLRERYKDDKQRMNSELMKLYREQKANPLAGCLPLLAQIPVFFALYYMLFTTIEMRHAPFFGWINDLSAPDPMTFITVFGLLEWPAPEFLLIGIWPIIFGVTMWLQMKLNPQPMEPIQQKILMALPIIFLFLFARFPAGLVVYWTWNNVLSIGQQWLIMRRMGITRQSLAEDAEKIRKIKEAAEKGTLLKPSRSRRKTASRPKDRAGEASAAAGGKGRAAPQARRVFLIGERGRAPRRGRFPQGWRRAATQGFGQVVRRLAAAEGSRQVFRCRLASPQGLRQTFGRCRDPSEGLGRRGRTPSLEEGKVGCRAHPPRRRRVRETRCAQGGPPRAGSRRRGPPAASLRPAAARRPPRRTPHPACLSA